MAQEGSVDTGVPEGEGLAVDADGAVLEGSDEVVGGVLEGGETAALLPAV